MVLEVFLFLVSWLILMHPLCVIQLQITFDETVQYSAELEKLKRVPDILGHFWISAW